jgi:fructan beta-fructosidase
MNAMMLMMGAMAVTLMHSPAQAELKTREIAIKEKLLLVPVSAKPPKPAEKKTRGTSLEIRVGDTLVHKLNVVLAGSKEETAWWGYLEMDEYAGKTAKLSVDVEADSKGLELIENADAIRNPEPLYTESLRPRFHFMQKQGWNNDPNGMVYFDGEYHFFWQCNPLGKQWANMYWGHAVSKDLLHWEELPRAMRPFGGNEKNRHPSMSFGSCFSGSANVDVNNSLGVQKGDTKTLVAAYTDTGYGEVLAYSTDKGRNWVYDQKMNPVIKHDGRDPKLVWFQPGQHWVVAVYDVKAGKPGPKKGRDAANNNIAIYTSKDLKEWTLTDNVPGFFECPELFELSLDGKKEDTRWVMMGANGAYVVGTFDGKKFKPEHEGKHSVLSGNIYAGQCFSRAPDGRVIYIGWARRVEIPMPATFNQGYTVPIEFTLKTTTDGIRLFANPVKELDQLHDKALADLAGEKAAQGCSVDAPDQEYDILITLKKTGDTGSCSLSLGGRPVKMSAMTGNAMDVRVLVDRTTIEVIENGGATYRLESRDGAMGKPVGKIEIKPEGAVVVEKVQIFKMKSCL